MTAFEGRSTATDFTIRLAHAADVLCLGLFEDCFSIQFRLQLFPGRRNGIFKASRIEALRSGEKNMLQTRGQFLPNPKGPDVPHAPVASVNPPMKHQEVHASHKAATVASAGSTCSEPHIHIQFQFSLSSLSREMRPPKPLSQRS